MKIIIRVIAGAKVPGVKKVNGMYRVKVAIPAEKGRANKEVVVLLAKHFGVKERDIEILSGHTARTKMIQINK